MYGMLSIRAIPLKMGGGRLFIFTNMYLYRFAGFYPPVPFVVNLTPCTVFLPIFTPLNRFARPTLSFFITPYICNASRLAIRDPLYNFFVDCYPHDAPPPSTGKMPIYTHTTRITTNFGAYLILPVQNLQLFYCTIHDRPNNAPPPHNF